MDTPKQDIQPITPPTNFIPITIGLLGITLAIISLFFSLGSSKDKALRQEMSYLEETLHKIKTQTENLEFQFNQFNAHTTDQIFALSTQTQKALNQIGEEISTTRNRIAANQEAIQEIMKRIHASTNLALEKSNDSGVTPSPTAAHANDDAPVSFHIIQSGDTFAKLAKAYHVNIQELIAMNPQIDPRRLQIGQKVNIPQPE